MERSSLHKVYNVMNFLARSLASTKPSATNIISQINSNSGTTIAQGLSLCFVGKRGMVKIISDIVHEDNDWHSNIFLIHAFFKERYFYYSYFI